MLPLEATWWTTSRAKQTVSGVWSRMTEFSIPWTCFTPLMSFGSPWQSSAPFLKWVVSPMILKCGSIICATHQNGLWKISKRHTWSSTPPMISGCQKLKALECSLLYRYKACLRVTCAFQKRTTGWWGQKIRSSGMKKCLLGWIDGSMSSMTRFQSKNDLFIKYCIDTFRSFCCKFKY